MLIDWDSDLDDSDPDLAAQEHAEHEKLRATYKEMTHADVCVSRNNQLIGWTVEVVERFPRICFVVTADGQFHCFALLKTFEPLPR